jgi:quercetin dioxygenase-like cupin family protein
MKLGGQFYVGGKVIKEDDRYVVRDNNFLKNLVLSSTDLKPGKETNGHSHSGQEEVYFFTEGSGVMQLNLDKFDVRAGDMVLIADGVFHKVYNNSKSMLTFVCVFDGTRKS